MVSVVYDRTREGALIGGGCGAAKGTQAEASGEAEGEVMRLDYESKRSGPGRWKKVMLIVGACVSGSAFAFGVVIAAYAYHGESVQGFQFGVLLSAAASSGSRRVCRSHASTPIPSPALGA